ncbi:uncharacterized protein LOC119746540 [Patiria miniata]|uniref:SCP domain-containing protein n=1 Tax=Patiria miniata TaxID=46514 RepID=A0A914BT21_PATMI|nr:uncharacterized protein LOC119746540 [Patiria miniata]
MIRVMVVVALLSQTLLTSGALVPMVRQLDTNLPNNHSKAASKLPTTQRDLKQQSGRAETTTRGRTESPTSPPSTSSPSTFREDALRLHNHARRKTEPPAANMPWLRWNSDLAYLAELWSRRCVVDYGLPLSPAPFTYNGRILQNVWSGQHRNGGIGGTVSSWLAEGREFNYGTGACYRAGGCRHYLTMTSATVHEVGCGFSKCHDDIMIVCYYGTRSSSQGPDSPLSHYAAGPPCSKCGADEWCDDGLCRSQVKQWKSESADDNCQCDKMEDASLSSDSELDDSALTLGSYTVILYRHRRQAAANGSTTAPIDCGYLDIPLWIFVGLLAFIVVLGLVIGIIAMCICICKDTCRSCMNGIGRCCRCRGSQSSDDGRRRNGRKCTIRFIWCRRCRKVRPTEDNDAANPDDGSQTDLTRDDEDTPDGPIVEEPPTQVDDASPNAEQKTYRNIGTNTDEVECTATSIEKREFHDVKVQVKAESQDTGVQVTPETEDTGMQVELVEDDKEVNPEDDEREEQENSEDDDGQVPEVPSPSSPSSTSSSSPPSSKSSSSKPRSSSKHPWGKCLERGCKTCRLHTRDQREVHKEKLETLRKINEANRNPNLKPGDRIF